MLKKNFTKTGRKCRVTFKLPEEVHAERAFLCGDFNERNPAANPMKKLIDGSFSTTISLHAGKSYRFRYFLDEGRWENDREVGYYLPNEHGAEDSVVTV